MERQGKRIERKVKRTRRPTPPGEMLQKEFLEPAGITQSELARHIGCDIKTINRLVNERTSLTPEMAQKLAAAFGTTPDFWMNLQQSVDLYDARQKADDLPDLIVDRSNRAVR